MNLQIASVTVAAERPALHSHAAVALVAFARALRDLDESKGVLFAVEARLVWVHSTTLVHEKDVLKALETVHRAVCALSYCYQDEPFDPRKPRWAVVPAAKTAGAAALVALVAIVDAWREQFPAVLR